MLTRIKKDDLVTIISGKDKGKQGNVLRFNKKDDKVLVKGIAIVTRHLKARRQGDKSGIVKEESYIPLSKVMPVCTQCKSSCRIRVKYLSEDKKVRVCHRCQQEF